jgi:hypothetical protein
LTQVGAGYYLRGSVAKYDSYRDDPYPAPAEQHVGRRENPERWFGRRFVIRSLVVTVVIILGVASLNLWARLFICDLWGPLFHGRLPGVFGRMCR